jgi:hypothetical protein
VGALVGRGAAVRRAAGFWAAGFGGALVAAGFAATLVAAGFGARLVAVPRGAVVARVLAATRSDEAGAGAGGRWLPAHSESGRRVVRRSVIPARQP